MSHGLERALRGANVASAARQEIEEASRSRAREILRALTPPQRDLVTDPSPHISGLCPRRAGKSFAGAAAALITGEAKPESISIIISLNLKQLKRLYWSGGTSGIFALDRRFHLGLEFNATDLSWRHQNGSIGYLLGAETYDQREVIRGLEADLYLVDECKSFAPDDLNELIDDIIDPQRNTRRGRLILIGTPGSIPAGPFYEATCEKAVSDEQDPKPFLIPYGQKEDKWGRTATEDLLWSFHHWTLQDNIAAPHQWEEALRKKRSKRWADDHPSWLREALGQWTSTTEGLIFRYFAEKTNGGVTWVPERTADNPTGLPAEGAPWRFIAGLDLGYEAPSALVIAAYSQRTRELRHIWDWQESHMLPADIAQLVRDAERRFGIRLERIVVDTGNLGRTIAAQLQEEYGLPIERAEKREKFDHIELLNEGFSRGEIKIIPGTTLEKQLITNEWLLRDLSFAEAVKIGRLVEDKQIPNHCTDALLYLYRAAMHHYGTMAAPPPPVPGTEQWVKVWEKEQLQRARREAALTPLEKALSANSNRPMPLGVRAALTPERKRWKTTSTAYVN